MIDDRAVVVALVRVAWWGSVLFLRGRARFRLLQGSKPRLYSLEVLLVARAHDELYALTSNGVNLPPKEGV